MERGFYHLTDVKLVSKLLASLWEEHGCMSVQYVFMYADAT